MKTHTDSKTHSAKGKTTDTEAKRPDKQEKLAMALRLNLKRRKESSIHVIDKSA